MNEVIDKLDALVQSGGADFVLAEQMAAGLGIQLESLPTVKKYTPVIEFFNLFCEGYDNLDDGIQNLIPLKRINLNSFGLVNFLFRGTHHFVCKINLTWMNGPFAFTTQCSRSVSLCCVAIWIIKVSKGTIYWP